MKFRKILDKLFREEAVKLDTSSREGYISEVIRLYQEVMSDMNAVYLKYLNDVIQNTEEKEDE